MLLFSMTIAEEDVVLTYRNLGKGLYRLGNTGHIVEHWSNFLKDAHMMGSIKRNIKQYNTYIPATDEVKKYLYFVENSRSVDVASDLSGY